MVMSSGVASSNISHLDILGLQVPGRRVRHAHDCEGMKGLIRDGVIRPFRITVEIAVRSAVQHLGMRKALSSPHIILFYPPITKIPRLFSYDALMFLILESLHETFSPSPPVLIRY